MISRRSLLSIAAASPLLRAAKKIPVGLEMYSVRSTFKTDPEEAIRRVAKMGYSVVEIYSLYWDWPAQKTKDMRKLLDDLNVRCLSTHNDGKAFATEGIERAIELNGILGSQFAVMASAGRVDGLDGWKRVAGTLAAASEKFAPAKLRAGYHNHSTEFTAIDGKRPMDVIAANTPKNVMLQCDVGHCVSAGADPVAWINANPGRINSLHLKDWSPGEKYEAIFGKGAVRWKKVFEAAEKTGGAEFYLIEYEGHEAAPFEPVQECLANYKKIHG